MLIDLCADYKHSEFSAAPLVLVGLLAILRSEKSLHVSQFFQPETEQSRGLDCVFVTTEQCIQPHKLPKAFL